MNRGFDFDEMSSDLGFSNMEKTLEATILVKEIQEDIRVFREGFKDMVKSGNLEKVEPFYMALASNVEDKLERLPQGNISISRTLKMQKEKIKIILEKIRKKTQETIERGESKQ